MGTKSTVANAQEHNAPLAVYVLRVHFSLKMITYAVNVNVNDQEVVHKGVTSVNVAICLKETWHTVSLVVV